MPALGRFVPRLKLKGEFVVKAADFTAGVELGRFAPRLKLKVEVVVKAADATAGVKLESANMMVARVSDSIFDFLLLFLFCRIELCRHLWRAKET